MRLSHAALFQYRLPLCKPLILKSHSISRREGLIVRLTDHEEHIGWGEIAPLPGFSVETLDIARDSAISFIRILRESELPEPEALLQTGICTHMNISLAPSVACGLESAIISLWASSQGRELRHLVNPSSPDIVMVNGLLSGTESVMLELARQLIDNGFKTLKLKVGSESVARDTAKVRALRKIAPDCALRLDANRQWDLDTAVQFGKAVGDLDIEYIEEPVADRSILGEFHSRTGIPYALDESLLSQTPDSLANRAGLRAIILKPTLLGGLALALNYARRAGELGLLPVISSAFESSVGLLTLANLASAVAPNIACGLDTASWFSDDLLARPLMAADGTLRLAEFSISNLPIRDDLLTEIPVSR